MSHDNDQPENRTANIGYAEFKLHSAFITAEQHEDAKTRERARQKIKKWQKVIEGMHDASLTIGSRTPVENRPAWMTLEVVTGGFATGDLMAAGPLLEFERELLSRNGIRQVEQLSEAQAREWLNGYFISESGLPVLMDQVKTGRYEILQPEEGALCVVAWLIHSGFADSARDLIEQLAPYFSDVRFYPRPSEVPVHHGPQVFLRNVSDVTQNLKEIQPNDQIMAQRESINVWQPLYDRTVSLFLETLDGTSPTLVSSENGQPEIVTGGWPCKHFPADFAESAQAILSEHNVLRMNNEYCHKPLRKDNFGQLRIFLKKYLASGGEFSKSDIARIRTLIARYVTKRGLPNSLENQGVRSLQQQQIDIPMYAELARVIVDRLKMHEKKSGIEDLGEVTAPVQQAESSKYEVSVGTKLPVSMLRKLERCLMDTIDALVEKKVIKSGEMLAIVLPQLTSNLRSVGIEDTVLRQLCSVIYRAFRKRRSLLLLNYESQVRLEELPWIEVIDRFRQPSMSAELLARQTMSEIMLLTLVYFPHVIVPNKLLQELRALAATGKVEIPLVDELAADIFMGGFSNKFVEAAKISAELLNHSLYSTYFRIDYDAILRIPVRKQKKSVGLRRSVHAPNTSPQFAKICFDRAGVPKNGFSVAKNGMVIEQQQILTTQNLAPIYDALEMHESMRPHLPILARSCFAWICDRLQISVNDGHSRLIMIKNSAYAWRQMIFFLSMMDDQEGKTFSTWANDHLNSQARDFVELFGPVVLGLDAAIVSHIDGGEIPRDFQPFTGWSAEAHPLMGKIRNQKGVRN